MRRIPVANCGKYVSEQECLSAKDPYCGWCSWNQRYFLYFRLSYKSYALLVSVHFDWLGAIQYQDYIYWIFMESVIAINVRHFMVTWQGALHLLKSMLTFRFLRSTHKTYVGLKRRNDFGFRRDVFALRIDWGIKLYTRARSILIARSILHVRTGKECSVVFSIHSSLLWNHCLWFRLEENLLLNTSSLHLIH